MDATDPIAAGPGLPDRRGRAPGGAPPPGRGGRDPVCHSQRVRVAGGAGRLPALAHRLWPLPAVECGRGDHCPARRLTCPGPPGRWPGRGADRSGARLPVGPCRGDRAQASRGWDNAKKVNGRKRHLAVDTTGLLLEVLATAASVQDRDAAAPLLFNLHRARRRVRRAWADSVYAGKLQPWAATYLHLTVEIVRRPQDQHTFEVLPRRWVVERTLAWITSYRRCARDYERLPAHHEAAVYWAMITLLTHRLARPG